MSAAAAWTSSGRGGSECRWRSVSRTQPMSTDTALTPPGPPPPAPASRALVARPSPTTNSVEPPPMSTTR